MPEVPMGEAYYQKIEDYRPEKLAEDSMKFQVLLPAEVRDLEDWERKALYPWTPIPWSDCYKLHTPFGYKKDAEVAKMMGLGEDDILFPVENELFALEEAKRMWKYYNQDDVTEWLVRKTGRKITKHGLRSRIESDHKRCTRASFYRKMAARVAKLIITAQKIEEGWPNAQIEERRAYDKYGYPKKGVNRRGKPSVKNGVKTIEELFAQADCRNFIRGLQERLREEHGEGDPKAARAEHGRRGPRFEDLASTSQP